MTQNGADRPAADADDLGAHAVHLALHEPDQPGNAGTILRLGACLGVHVHIIEPAGFALGDRALRRAGMDYLAGGWTRHDDWSAFEAWVSNEGRRIVLATTAGSQTHASLEWRRDDVILMGSESRGVPPAVHARADERVRIPMRGDARSLNVAVSAAIVVGEALRAVGAFGR